MSNRGLNTAKALKNDEYYTRYEDIELELSNYTSLLKGKSIFCPCDDYAHSNFVKYFIDNFELFGLKALYSSCIDSIDEAKRLEYYGKDNPLNKKEKIKYSITTEEAKKIILDDLTIISNIKSFKYKASQRLVNRIDYYTYTINDEEYRFRYITDSENKNNVTISIVPLGAFQHKCSDRYFDLCDIVITNPPFSNGLPGELINTCFSKNKQFLIISPSSAVFYESVKNFVANVSVSAGYNRVRKFVDDKNEYIKDEKGKDKTFGNIIWYTNLKNVNHEKFELTYEYDPKYYPVLNDGSIDVDLLEEIPKNFAGKMSVPTTIFEKMNYDQFTILYINKRAKIYGGELYTRVTVKLNNPVGNIVSEPIKDPKEEEIFRLKQKVEVKYKNIEYLRSIFG